LSFVIAEEILNGNHGVLPMTNDKSQMENGKSIHAPISRFTDCTDLESWKHGKNNGEKGMVGGQKFEPPGGMRFGALRPADLRRLPQSRIV
jgi:hypothetical protein